LDRLPTKDKLIEREVQVQRSLCELCLASDESVEHLFFSCKVFQKVWNMCDNRLGGGELGAPYWS